MAGRSYFRPIPQAQGGRWRLAGGWTGFSQLERLTRGAPPRIVDDAPAEVLAALTAPRAPVAGLAMDRPRLMGIVNATPDSFSDGGRYDPVAHLRALADAGAAILDIGGESTRPGADEIDPATETARILPAIRAARGLAPVSVDTRKAAVAQAAIAAGAVMVNDVSGLDFDPGLADVVAASDLPLCLMHAQGLPQDMQDDPRYDDVLLDVFDALEARIARAEAAGIARDRIIVDPGIGFGKTEAHNLSILRRISLYHGLGCPILLGVSRKRFIGRIGRADPPAARMPGTLALSVAAIAQGVQIHRVHDVAEHAQALRVIAALNDKEDEAER
ncbi:dihydropteroate synthase [Paracoccus aestuarii]|uniref:Dihydropteroate synthase n=1 Tax=Paracoccus aestuarii TaxID=453842 RepID=A0A418ZPF9_9RHOB|nr:dihydropteroate synthase [Paracoccus aestuarii]RJK96231.1 dihydropteroate synthase [Paracoccus aestuarii]WCQ98168.1 dihydropteroate synthase [Paracoccus aestuarii]